jgi:hypothetical protein
MNIKSYKRDRETGALSKRRAARSGTEEDDEEVEPREDEQDGDEQDGDEGGNADDYQNTWRWPGSPGQGDDDGGLDGEEKDKEDEQSNTESEGEVATRKRKAPVLAAGTSSPLTVTRTNRSLSWLLEDSDSDHEGVSLYRQRFLLTRLQKLTHRPQKS